MRIYDIVGLTFAALKIGINHVFKVIFNNYQDWKTVKYADEYTFIFSFS